MNGDGCGTVFWGKKGNQDPGQVCLCNWDAGKKNKRMLKIV